MYASVGNLQQARLAHRPQGARPPSPVPRTHTSTSKQRAGGLDALPQVSAEMVVRLTGEGVVRGTERTAVPSTEPARRPREGPVRVPWRRRLAQEAWAASGVGTALVGPGDDAHSCKGSSKAGCRGGRVLVQDHAYKLRSRPCFEDMVSST
jgi:hypothetical protein